jgi:hypothetical protein
MAKTGSIKIYQNRLGPAQGRCCLKNVEIFDLTLFWYSPTKHNYHLFRKSVIYVLYPNIGG